jgi:hypothetical protein
MRRSDLVGVAGIAVLLLGWLGLRGSDMQLRWWTWLGAPLLWFAGFALIATWLFLRWFAPPR